MIDIANDLKNWIHRNFFTKLDFTSTSRGAQDAHRPIVLNNSGVLDSSLGGGGGGGNIAYTDAANVFTRIQTITPSITDATLGSELLVDGSFPSLTNWNDDASGWNVVSGGITHTPGATGEIFQNFTLTPSVCVLEFKVSGMTTGWAEVFNSSGIDITTTTNGVFKDIHYTDSPNTVWVDVSADFDGKIEYVSFKPASSYPASLTFFDKDGNETSSIRAAWGGLYAGFDAGKISQEANIGIGNFALDAMVDDNGNAAFGVGAGQGARGDGNLYFGVSAGRNSNALSCIYIGPSAGDSNTTSSKVFLGQSNPLLEGTMDASASNQILQVHAATIIFADLPTSAAGLPTGALWNDSGTLKVA